MQKEQLIAKFQELYGEGGKIRTYFALTSKPDRRTYRL